MMQVVVLRRGELAFQMLAGYADLSRQTPLADNTIMRVYSMTKPIVSAAVMILVERAQLQLDDPVSKFLPCFAEMTVHDPCSATGTTAATTPITLHHLLTHTAGLTYAFFPNSVGRLYREANVKFEAGWGYGVDPEDTLPHYRTPNRDVRPGALRRMVEKLAALPLICEPGTAFNYSHCTDVVGCIIEVVTGQLLGDFLRAEIFEPLGMIDTGFSVRLEDAHRFAACYLAEDSGGRAGLKLMDDPKTSEYLTPCDNLCAGGAGLVSTLRDMTRFTAMLAGKGACPSATPFGGESTRLLSRTSIEFMMLDHLPPGVTVPSGLLHCRDGVGFGIGGSVTNSAARNALVGSVFSWGNLANGYWSIDSAEELVFLMLTQVVPSSKRCHWRRDLQSLLQASVID